MLAQRAAVRARDAARLTGAHLVREPLLAEDGDRRGAVLGGAEVLEHARAAALAEPQVERVGHLRPRQLVAAAAAEDPADQRRGRHQVGRLEVRRALWMS